ncbi:porin family protein [Flavobacterium taihuense]|uniref:PorT family protein n=1 Tax=Flavobacterium taihuense TaxID=2857508 RepID=A0ABS6XXC8_9FLAO|nr:porin family protein [Flavobacterium taihuense]MBW4361335.1 PorT family protein [Flavobacterium taihuense]
MKKIILAAVAVLVFGFTNAQKAQFGIKGGLNVANQIYSEDGAPSPSSIIGFHIGGFVEVKMSDKFSIQPEVLYSTQGSKFDMNVDYNGTNYNTEDVFKLSYINIPIMFKYYAAERFSLEAGPQIGFLTSSKLDVTVLGQSVSQNAKDLFESVDFGLNIGAGFDFTKNFSAGVRYNFGLANVAKTEGGDDSTVKNGVFSVSLGYKF